MQSVQSVRLDRMLMYAPCRAHLLDPSGSKNLIMQCPGKRLVIMNNVERLVVYCLWCWSSMSLFIAITQCLIMIDYGCGPS